MKISIYGPMKAKPMKIQGYTLVSEYRLQFHLRINEWYDFIDYIKKYPGITYKPKGE